MNEYDEFVALQQIVKNVGREFDETITNRLDLLYRILRERREREVVEAMSQAIKDEIDNDIIKAIMGMA